MKRVKIGSVTFSKVICGSNPFYGHSHFSEAKNAEYRKRFDDRGIEEVLHQCVSRGVNTIESCANERIVSILSALRTVSPEPVHFVGTTRIDETSSMKSHRQKLSFLISQRAEVCAIHAQYVDRADQGVLPKDLRSLVDEIHQAGLLAGISTHRVRTIDACENQGLGIDLYMFPLNLQGFVYPGYDGSESVQDRVGVVRGVVKPFILIKTLGTGRIPPGEGLQFVAENSKPQDLISLGLASREEIEESLGVAESLFKADGDGQ